MADLLSSRADIDAWVDGTFQGTTFVHSGGQRLVYQTPSPTRAALKVWLKLDTSQHQRHVREVSALAVLDHPGLPKVVSHLSEATIGSITIAFYQEEWIEAPTMKSLLEADGLPLGSDEALSFLRSALDVLGALHSADIVHRDVSLGNVLWNGQQAFITDLGLAKHLGQETLTGMHERLPLTLLTASPEQLQGASADLRQPTDIYSLGNVTAFAVTGSHPFVGVAENVDIPTLVQRQLTSDFRNLPDNQLGRHLRAMMNPVSFYRPSALALLVELA